jgi:hypothetical protein
MATAADNSLALLLSNSQGQKRIKNKTQVRDGWQRVLRVDAWLRLDGAHIEAKTGGESIILWLETKGLR